MKLAEAEPSGLAVLFPDLSDALDPVRSRFDPAASQGLAPHVTVLFPFHPPGDPGDTLDAALTSLFAHHSSFDIRFARLGRFPDALYLAPEPADPFIALTRAVWDAFPDRPPYGGAHDGIVPHLTLAQGEDPAPAEAACLDLPLPLTSRASAVSHLVLRAGIWHEVRSYPLGAPARS